MPCLVALIALLFPRVVLFCIWLFSTYLNRAYDSVLWPVLGFIFLPLTTLAYAWAINSNGSVSGIYLAVVVVAVLVDLGMIGGSSKSRRNRR